MRIEERRLHKRFNLAPFLVTPVTFINKKTNTSFSGIIVDLSCGGMCMIIYEDIPIETELVIDFNLGKIKVKGVIGKIFRIKENYKTYQVAVKFSHINNTIKEEINDIAEDYNKCEISSETDPKFRCFKSCYYYFFCSKPIKV